MAGNTFYYPKWFRDAGYFLVSIETNCGVRFRLNKFFKANAVGCAYIKAYEYPLSGLDELQWHMRMVGPFDTVRSVPCTELEHDMLFYSPLGTDEIVPPIDGYGPTVWAIQGKADFERQLVEFYITRAHTWDLVIGKYYVGFVIPTYKVGGSQTVFRDPPRVPPAIFFVHDAFAAFTDNSGILELPA